SEGKRGSATLTVTPAPLASVSVALSAPSVAVSGTTQSVATTTDALGLTATDRPVTWSSSNTLVATVSSTGVVTGVNPGRARIVATVEGFVADAEIHVTGTVVFADLSAGDTHTCGLSTGGVAYCWGDNQWGQLGDGTTTNRSAPTAV